MVQARGIAAGTTPSTPAIKKKDAIEDGDPIVKPSLSASLILLAPLQQRTVDGYDYRILLLKRNAKSSTFVSAHVFPGGNMDPIDTSTEWDHLYPTSATPTAEESRLRAIKICAVRETFEECGILLSESTTSTAKDVWDKVPEQERMAWRDKVHSNGTAFLDLFKMISSKDSAHPSRPALSSLQYRANWITPRNMKRRFDTHFFMAVVPPSISVPTESSEAIISEPIASADGKETVSADWLTPSEAMRRTLEHTRIQQAGETVHVDSSIILFPPQFYLLAELSETKSWRDLLDNSDVDLAGFPKVKERSIEPFEPEMRAVLTSRGEKRAATVLPGDPEHSMTKRMMPNAGPEARHRTYVLLPGKAKTEELKKKQPLGLTVMGVHREGLSSILGPQWGYLKEGDVGEGSSKMAKL